MTTPSWPEMKATPNERSMHMSQCSSKESNVEPLSSQSEQSQQSQDSAPRFDYVSSKKKKGATTRESKSEQWVCMLPEKVLSSHSDCNSESHSSSSFSLVSLPDPCNGASRDYVLGSNGDEIFELQKFSDGPRSWFVGDQLCPDGSLYVCTPIDPLFIALPHILKSSKVDKFTTSDGLLDSETCPHWSLLDRVVSPEQWGCICETKKLPSGDVVYRYCPKKTINWLSQKVAAVVEGLKEENVHVGCGAQSSSYVRSKKDAPISEDDYISYACGIVCDYLPSSLGKMLSDRYQCTEKRKRLGDEEDTGVPPAKKPVTEEGNQTEPFENYYTAPSNSKSLQKQTKLTTAQKALAKTSKRGMKPLTKFFGKS